jgi:hypothetical protein
MPLIIIVGLLGFSFLGAALARIVKAGTSDRAILGWLSIPDLVVFIISGAAASLTVYAASYGGLAVLGDAGGNPNAYVVFTLCFAAALFSEKVWDWLREILGRVTGDGVDDQTEDPAPEEEDGDDAPVLTIFPDAVATADADADYNMLDLIKTPAERARNATRRKDKAKPADPDK